MKRLSSVAGRLLRVPLLVVLLSFSPSAEAVTIIGPLDTNNLNGTINDSVLNQGALVVHWVNNVGSFSLITGSLENNPGVLRIIANDPSGGFHTNSRLVVNGGVQNEGTILLETTGSFGNSGAFSALEVGTGTSTGTLTNLPAGLIETKPHVGVGASGNSIAAALQNQGTFNHNASTTLSIGNVSNDPVGANHANGGTINVNAGAVQVQSFNSFANSGTIQGRSVTLSGFPNGVQPGEVATVTNSGLIAMTAGDLVVSSIDSFTNTGTGQLNLTGGNGSFSHFNTFVNQGDITIVAGRTLSLAGGIFDGLAENQPGGKIDGGGTLSVAAGTTFTNNGTIAPGSSFGELTVLGDLIQGTTGILDIEIGGTDPAVTHDQLIMSTGTATLGGTLRLRFVGGFAPSAGQTFDLIAGAVINEFDFVELLGLEPGFDFNLTTSSGLTLIANNNAVAVPEPTGILLALLAAGGLLAVSWSDVRRRRRSKHVDRAIAPLRWG